MKLAILGITKHETHQQNAFLLQFTKFETKVHISQFAQKLSDDGQ